MNNTVTIDIDTARLKRPKYKTKYVVSLNWDTASKVITEEFLEERQAFLVHFITDPVSKIDDIPKFEPHLTYPNSDRVLAKAQYIGNIEGVEWGGSFTKTMEVIHKILAHWGFTGFLPSTWGDLSQEPIPYEIIQVIR